MSWAKHNQNTEILKEAAGGELNFVLIPRRSDLFWQILCYPERPNAELLSQ